MRIWFNHWFSSVYQIIRMMKEGCQCPLEVIGSNRRAYAVYKSLCDEWYVEPDACTDEEYLEYCLDFCKEHRIDVFAPRRGLSIITEHAERFETAGVKLLVGLTGPLARQLDDKEATYALLEKAGITSCIPPYRIAHSLEEFLQAYDELKNDGNRVCYKLTLDEGARSFRIVDDRVLTSRALLEKPGFKLTLDTAKAVLAQYDFSVPMMLMPYLDGPEISADCMQTSRGKLIIPRYKQAGRYSEIRFEPEVLQLCGELMDAVGAKMPVNIQFRMHKGQLYLLEINPRMSGGIQLSCEASGIALPAVAINELLGCDAEWEYPDFECRRAAHVEKPVCLD